jgi:tRNA modification GTPase
MVDLGDTICALSSAPGRSGIAVVRISGPGSFPIIQRFFAPARAQETMPERHATLGRIFDPRSGIELDQALVTRFHSPRSYTGEDVAEISVHGSPVVIAHVLECLCALGARLAEPGEFTLRAFLHGRMDLAQAEAVRDVIEANTLYQLQVAARQRSGDLSRQLEPLKKELIDLIVSLETAVEFADQDLSHESRETISAKLGKIRADLAKWTGSFRRGRIVRNGFSLAIVGRPNVGKSSLFNALLSEERSIVTEIPGTTRDLVSESANIEGIPVRLIDTAGMRSGEDKIEQIGVDRSIRVMADVDAILLVLDASRPCGEEDRELRERLSSLSCIVAFNKTDLPGAWSASERSEYAVRWPCVDVSAQTGAHVELLRQEMHRHLFEGSGGERDGILVTNLRHFQCLEGAQLRIDDAVTALFGGLSEEFVLADLHRGLKKLGEITGETGVEEILGEIFSRFCIGK